MNKIIFFDTETTGLDYKVNGIHQLAGEITIGGEVIETFDFRIKPFIGCQVELDSLEVSNTNVHDILKYKKECHVLHLFCRMIRKHLERKNKKDKYFLAGWRAPEFDVKFLQALYERKHNGENDFKKLFWSNPIDVKVLATQYLINQRKEMKSFSLTAVAHHLGVEVDYSKLHDALYDAYLSRKIYEIVKL